jgi:hypothetical protein
MGEVIRNSVGGEYGGNVTYSRMKTETRPAETILRRGKGVKENDGGDESEVYCKHFLKYHNVTPVQ